MAGFARPVVVFSRCLGFAPCRYNGAMIGDEFLARLIKYVDPVTPCPEVEIGLGIPREPIRIVCPPGGEAQLVQPATGRDVTLAMNEYAARFCAALPPVDGFILKAKSPSCGQGTVKAYPAIDSKQSFSEKTDGLFVRVARARFPSLPFEDEGRLNSFVVRERFLTRIFTLAAFRAVEAGGMFAALLDFHTRNKELLRFYSQPCKQEMGRILAAHDGHNARALIAQYRPLLERALATHPRREALANFFEHGLGYFKDDLTASDRGYFQECMDGWREGRLPVSSPLTLLRGWAVHFKKDWLLAQSLLAPFPPELADIHDSGKGRDV